MKLHLGRRVFVVGTTVVVLGASGTAVLAARNTAAPTYTTVVAGLGTVTQTLALSGNLSPASQTNLDFLTSGRVTAVNVTAGQNVSAGQVLATLDTTALQGSLQTAQASLASAQARLSLDQQGATTQSLSSSQQAIASAETNLQNSQVSYNDSLAINNQSLLAAQSAVTSAQNLVNADNSKLTVDQGVQTSDCNPPPGNAQCAADNQTVAADQDTLAKDNGAWQSALAAQSATALKVQQGNDQAAASLASARVQLQNAEAQLNALRTGTTSQQLTIDQSSVTTAQVAATNAQNAVAEATLTSPVDGQIVEVNVTVGASVSGGGSGSGSSSSASSATTHNFVVITPGLFQVTGSVSDSQVSHVVIGQRARVIPAGTTEALDGTVTFVAPEATVTSGVASFAVTVKVTQPSAALRSGMSATVSVIINQVAHTLTVPTGAVHTAGGSSYVNTLVNGAPHQTTVTVGAQDATLTQIIDGVAVGDTIVLATVSSTVPSATGSGTRGGAAGGLGSGGFGGGAVGGGRAPGG